MNNLSLICLFSLNLGAILWSSEILSSCVCFFFLRVFPLFPKLVADIITPTLSIILHRLNTLGPFPECWRFTNITASPMGIPSHNKENYRPISITHIPSKVHEKLVPHKLSYLCYKCYLVCCSVCLYERSGLHYCTAYHISSPSDILKCRDGVEVPGAYRLWRQ